MGTPAVSATRRDSTANRAVRCWWTAAWCGVLSVVLLVLVTLRWVPLLSADHTVAGDLHRLALGHPVWTEASRVLTDWVWDPLTMRAVLLLAAFLLAWHRNWVQALIVMAAIGAGAALQQGMKAAVGRQRPVWAHPLDSAHYASFPSGHAMTAALACTLAAWLLALHGVRGRWLRAACAVAALCVAGTGFTRLYLGVHWLSDVLEGWLLGVAVAAVAAAACARWGAVSPREA